MRNFIYLLLVGLVIVGCQKEDIIEDDMNSVEAIIEEGKTSKTAKTTDWLWRSLPSSIKIKDHKNDIRDMWYPGLQAKTTIGWEYNTGAARTWIGNMTDAKQWTSKAGDVYRSYHYRGGKEAGTKEPLVILFQERKDGDWIFRGITWRDGSDKVTMRSRKNVYINKSHKFQIWTKITKYKELLTSFLYNDRYIIEFVNFKCKKLKMGEDGMKGQPNVGKYMGHPGGSPKNSKSGSYAKPHGAIGGKCN